MDLEKHARENVINGRSLSELEHLLLFDREILKDRKLFVFGSGGGNLGKVLPSTEVVNMDILPNPIVIHDERVFPGERGYVKSALPRDNFIYDSDRDFPSNWELINFRKNIMNRKIHENVSGQGVFPGIDDEESKRYGIDGRKFIQGDGTKIEYPDNYFDFTFVSWVLHQIPFENQEQVLKELMRVSKSIIMSPVWDNRLRYIKEIAQEMDYEICGQIEAPYFRDTKGEPLIKTVDDFERVKAFPKFEPRTFPMIDDDKNPVSINIEGGATVILKKKNVRI